MGSKRIPIKDLKTLVDKHQQNIAILFMWDKNTGQSHVITYGKSRVDCKQAADGGNKLKKFLKWDEKLTHSIPSRCKKCIN